MPREQVNEADIMETLLDVVSVAAQEDYTLLLVFENGERRRFDMKPLLDKKPFSRLKDSLCWFSGNWTTTIVGRANRLLA
jgi:hypothetical protein